MCTRHSGVYEIHIKQLTIPRCLVLWSPTQDTPSLTRLCCLLHTVEGIQALLQDVVLNIGAVALQGGQQAGGLVKISDMITEIGLCIHVLDHTCVDCISQPSCVIVHATCR